MSIQEFLKIDLNKKIKYNYRHCARCALCGHFLKKDWLHSQPWFNENDLDLVYHCAKCKEENYG